MTVVDEEENIFRRWSAREGSSDSGSDDSDTRGPDTCSRRKKHTSVYLSHAIPQSTALVGLHLSTGTVDHELYARGIQPVRWLSGGQKQQEDSYNIEGSSS